MNLFSVGSIEIAKSDHLSTPLIEAATRSIKLSLIVSVMLLQPSLVSAAARPPTKEDIPPSSEWRERPASDRASVMEFLSTATRKNYDDLSTWSGVYEEESTSILGPSDFFGGDAPRPTRDKVRVNFRCSHRFVLDLINDSIFTSLENGDLDIEDEDENKVKLVQARAPEARSILTPEQYLSYLPKTQYGRFIVLRDVEQPTRRAAFRKPVDDAQMSLFSNSLDPRDLFGPDSHADQIWDNYLRAADILKRDRVPKDRPFEVSIFEAEYKDAHWFRVLLRFLPDKGPYKEYIHSSLASYNVVRYTEWTPNRQTPVRLYDWEWSLRDSIYVPAVVNVRYKRLTRKRTFSLKDSMLNEKLQPDAFSITALGLEHGDLVMDDVERIAYTYEDGNLNKLTDYASDEVPPEFSPPSHSVGSLPPIEIQQERQISPMRALLVSVNLLLFVVVLTVLFVAVRRRDRVSS